MYQSIRNSQSPRHLNFSVSCGQIPHPRVKNPFKCAPHQGSADPLWSNAPHLRAVFLRKSDITFEDRHALTLMFNASRNIKSRDRIKFPTHLVSWSNAPGGRGGNVQVSNWSVRNDWVVFSKNTYPPFSASPSNHGNALGIESLEEKWSMLYSIM